MDGKALVKIVKIVKKADAKRTSERDQVEAKTRDGCFSCVWPRPSRPLSARSRFDLSTGRWNEMGVR